MRIFQTLVRCPRCENTIALEDATTYVPLPEATTRFGRVSEVFTACPICRAKFWTTGGRLGAAVGLTAVFASIAAIYLTDSWIPIFALVAVIFFQKKILQAFIRTESA